MKQAMKSVRIGLVLCAAATLLCSQRLPRESDADIQLPSGKSQHEEILKMEYEKTVEEAGKLLDLAEELKIELEKNDRHVLSISSLKKAEEIEKLAKRIQKRLKR